MKKLISMLLVLVLAFALVACGSAPAQNEGTNEPANEPETTTPAEPEVVEEPVKVCFIIEQLGDNSFADASDRSLNEYVEKYGIEYFCTQVGAGGDQITATREAAQNGYDIVCVQYNAEVLAMVEEEAKEYHSEYVPNNPFADLLKDYLK